MESIIHDVVYFGSSGIAIGCVMGFAVIIVDYVFTKTFSMMKGGV